MHDTDSVLFDWGGVVIENPIDSMLDEFSRTLGVDRSALEGPFRRNHHDLQIGKIPEAEFWRKLTADLNVPQSGKTPDWYLTVERVFTTRSDIVQIIGRLRAHGIRTGLLSNTEAPTTRFARMHYRELFDSFIFSCDERIAKPDPRIYLLAVDRIGSSPERTLFIDDNPEYVEGAMAAGLRGLHFTDSDALRASLRPLLEQAG